MRPGDNLLVHDASSPAIPRPVKRCGRIRPHPHDEWDYDGINEVLPAQHDHRRPAAESGGPDRSDRLRLRVDRDNRRAALRDPLHARHLRPRASTSRPDGRSEDSRSRQHRAQRRTGICPAATGGRTAARGLFTADGMALQSGTRTSAWTTKAGEVGYIAGTPYVGAKS